MTKEYPYPNRGYVRLYGLDGSYVDIKHTKTYPNEMWGRNKCWSVFCRNELRFVLLNKSGLANHGYCFHVEEHILNGDGNYKLHKGQKWVCVEKGKLKIVKDAKREGKA